MGKHQALFVHPCSHPRIDAIRLAADGRRKGTRLSTEHMGSGRGVGFACSLWGKPPRSASCATDGGSRKARSAAARSRPCDGCYAFFFSKCILLAHHPHASQHLPGHGWACGVYKVNLSPHFLSRSTTCSLSTSQTLGQPVDPLPALHIIAAHHCIRLQLASSTLPAYLNLCPVRLHHPIAGNSAKHLPKPKLVSITAPLLRPAPCVATIPGAAICLVPVPDANAPASALRTSDIASDSPYPGSVRSHCISAISPPGPGSTILILPANVSAVRSQSRLQAIAFQPRDEPYFCSTYLASPPSFAPDFASGSIHLQQFIQLLLPPRTTKPPGLQHQTQCLPHNQATASAIASPS